MKATPIPLDIRQAVLERDNYRCRRCGTPIDFRGYSIHHRQGRIGADPHRFSNLVTLCGSGTTGCHGHVHHRPSESYSLGWLVYRNGLAQTEDVPLTNLRGRTVQLTNDGAVVPVLHVPTPEGDRSA